MTKAPDIITTILTSTVISSLITLLFKYFEDKQKYRFDIEMENIKTQLNYILQMQKAILDRREKVYPNMVELVYRARNMCRAIINNGYSPIILSELRSRMIEIEEQVFKFRIDLENDGTFLEMHSYKNMLKNFTLVVDDLSYLQSENVQGELLHETQQRLQSIYDSIEGLHKTLIEKITDRMLRVD